MKVTSIYLGLRYFSIDAEFVPSKGVKRQRVPCTKLKSILRVINRCFHDIEIMPICRLGQCFIRNIIEEIQSNFKVYIFVKCRIFIHND